MGSRGSDDSVRAVVFGFALRGASHRRAPVTGRSWGVSMERRLGELWSYLCGCMVSRRPQLAEYRQKGRNL